MGEDFWELVAVSVLPPGGQGCVRIICLGRQADGPDMGQTANLTGISGVNAVVAAGHRVVSR